ncbi:MAG: uroporphyrinogen decarboxylase family protein [Smithella sp.]|nr:uroporphyrinogen decarboxylase family protein [Smithella sp.]
MSPRERVIRTLEGKSVDRVPCFCAMMESRTADEILGKPPISTEFITTNPVSIFCLNKFPEVLTKPIARMNLVKTMHKRNVAQVKMGFDAIWALYDDSWRFPDAKTIAVTSGSIFNLIPDGFGDMTYMYRGPGIKTPEDFEAWPYWPDTDAQAHRVYKYFKKFNAEYGENTCIVGYGFFGGLQESMNWAFGIDKVPVWIKKHPDYVNRYLDIIEEIHVKTERAMLEAGVPIVMITDDSAYKTGPFLNPKMVEEVFGHRYRRIIRNVHDRGAKVIFHSCGDNTKLFDLFIGWGVDGLHAYENTSNVDIYNEKKIRGDKVTIIGGVGIDYLLTERSKDEEIVDKVKELIKKLGPGGRYMVAPVHSEDSLPAHKLQVMLDAVKKYGSYPISI